MEARGKKQLAGKGRRRNIGAEDCTDSRIRESSGDLVLDRDSENPWFLMFILCCPLHISSNLQTLIISIILYRNDRNLPSNLDSFVAVFRGTFPRCPDSKIVWLSILVNLQIYRSKTILAQMWV